MFATLIATLVLAGGQTGSISQQQAAVDMMSCRIAAAVIANEVPNFFNGVPEGWTSEMVDAANKANDMVLADGDWPQGSRATIEQAGWTDAEWWALFNEMNQRADVVPKPQVYRLFNRCLQASPLQN